MANTLQTQLVINADVQGTNEVNQLANSLGQVGDELNQATQPASATAQALGNVANSANNTHHSTTTLSQSIAQVNAGLAGTATPTTNASTAIGSLASTAGHLAHNTSHLTHSVGAVNSTLGATSSSAHTASASLGSLSQSANQSTTAVSRLDNAMGSVRSAFNGLKGLLGTLGVGLGAAQIIQMADEFNNLEARVKLATNAGGDFNAAMTSIKTIADSTAMPLTATADLFSKLTQSTKELGYSQSEVLDLTQTISQAMAVSGGDMASMEAGLTQLAQGLSAGALRGDELNSVLEQSPRLATALADGLGVTIGELRTMAGEGKLTAQVIGDALKSQADVIANEFAQMPATVSGSLTVLKNSLMGFIGELDNELQGASGLANFITQIADNINHIDPTVIEGLKNALDSTAIVAKTLYDSLAIVPNALGDVLGAMMGLEAGSGQISIIQGLMNGLALGTGAVADGFKALQIVITGVMAAVETQIARYANAFHSLTGFGGEFAKSISDSAKQTQDEFDKLAMGFESSLGKAMDSIAKGADGKLQEMASNVRQKYEQMAQDGQASATALENAFKDYAHKAIEANNGVVDEVLKQELAQKGLQAVIDDTGKVSITAMESLKGSVDEINLESLKEKFASLSDTLKLDFDKATIGVSENFKVLLQGVNDLSANYSNFTKNGIDGTQLLMQALDAMQKKANNEAELHTLAQAWQDLGSKGQLSTEQIKAGIDGVNSKIDEMTAGINSVSEAYKTLGIVSQADLQAQANKFHEAYTLIAKSGTATTQTLEEAFKKYAQIAIKANNGVADSTIKAQAAERGLAVQVSQTGQTTIVSKEQLKQAVDNVTHSTERLAQSGQNAGEAMAGGARQAKAEYDSLNKTIENANKIEQERKSANNKSNYNQFGTKTGIERFLKEAGLDEEQAMRGAAMFEAQGKQFSQFDQNGKHLSTRLMEYAESIRYKQKGSNNLGGLSNGVSPQEVAGAFDDLIRQSEARGAQNFAEQLMNEAKRLAR